MVLRASLDSPSLFINRELSWLNFNRRVLEEAEDESNPLLERVKYLAITASNLDEFFEVRVAAVLQRIEDGDSDTGTDGIPPVELAKLLAEETHDFMEAQYRCWNDRLRPKLADQGVRVLSLPELNADHKAFVDEYCARELDPLLTPVTVDPAHPFPRVINKALCQALLLKRRRRSAMTYMGVITVPRVLPRLIQLPGDPDSADYVPLSELVSSHAIRMYRGFEILSEGAFRVTRNSNLYLQEEESRNLLETVRTELHNRRKGDAVRLEIEAGASDEIIERLRSTFELDQWQVYRTPGLVSLSRLMLLHAKVDRPDLKFKPFSPRELHLGPKSSSIFNELRDRDILLHHPFDSYKSVVSFVEAAAEDPAVLSIKQTLYRTNENSPIVEALVDAASRKEVAAVVEVKARFDEAPNIRWARHLEDAGVQVFHGLVGLKTHCKLTLVVRKDEDEVTRRYAHLGTGNYNPSTAAFYTDLSLLTASTELTSAAHNVFNYLTSYAEHRAYDPLLVAPVDLAEHMIMLIGREADHARRGLPARIIAKMNGLLDANVVRELYRASQAGVEIDLIVRGICALKPGIRGVSDRIRVRSILGRFLEHSRIFYFSNAGAEEIYVGSADWMPRNLYERVEVLFPVRDPELRNRLRDEILAAYLADTCKARLLRRDGSYTRVFPKSRAGSRSTGFTAQHWLIEVAEGKKSPPVPSTPATPRRKRTVTAR